MKTLMAYRNTLKRVFLQPHKKFVVGQRRPNGDNWHNGRITPLMMQYRKKKHYGTFGKMVAVRKIILKRKSCKTSYIYCQKKCLGWLILHCFVQLSRLGNKIKLVYSDTAKKNAWKQHYQSLLNVEFPWDETLLSHIEPSIGPAPFITANMVLHWDRK